ncbi:AFG1-like ATPase-domain-containing protein [Usnea florida]
MPPLSPSTGLTITNPLVRYRALLATKQIESDPSQHRLALHLQKLYYRLKDYRPEVDFNHRLDQIDKVVNPPASEPAEAEHRREQDHGRRQGFLSSWRTQKENAAATALTRRLTSHESAVQLQSPQGLLLYGEVGTGKSLLVDLLADCLPNRGKKRWHFNTFMLDTFARLEQLRKSRLAESSALLRSGTQHEEHSLLMLARNMISTSPILFLDEFQLPDRAASKILSNLLTSFFHLGGVLIATSNRMPEELANASGIEFAAPPSSRLGLLGNRWGILGSRGQGGRSENMFAGKGDFAAFLEVLRARCEIWDMEGGRDWRRHEAEQKTSVDSSPEEARLKVDSESFEGLEPMASGNWGLGYEQSLHVKKSSEKVLSDKKKGNIKPPMNYFIRPAMAVPEEEVIKLDIAWKAAELDAIQSVANIDSAIPWKKRSLRVYGRNFLVPRHLSGVTKWTFDELCVTNLGPADYITLASTFHTLILTDVPILTLLQKNEARRFITLLDAFYEARCKLLISAEAGPNDIFFFPETNRPSEDGVSAASADDEIHPETFSEIFQDQTSPFRPNTSAYISSASPPSYTSSPLPHGPSDGAPGAGNEIGRQSPDFARTGSFTGEDERFAYYRARSRLWEMCGKKWWAREEGGWWRPLAKENRHWEGGGGVNLNGIHVPAHDSAPHTKKAGEMGREDIFRHGASPFRTSVEAPPKFGWEHAWGLVRWGKKAGTWGKGVEGLEERGPTEGLGKEKRKKR